MDYSLIKTIHVTAVALSGAGFFARGLGWLAGAAWVRGRLAKTLPHLLDTVLLVSALALAWTLHLAPAAAPWLGAKIAGLVVYIGLGVVALRPAVAPAMRGAAWVCALLTFGWIVSVAISRQPLGFLAAIFPAPA
jgi:uncharacterized membrane protein SirB2